MLGRQNPHISSNNATATDGFLRISLTERRVENQLDQAPRITGAKTICTNQSLPPNSVSFFPWETVRRFSIFVFLLVEGINDNPHISHSYLFTDDHISMELRSLRRYQNSIQHCIGTYQHECLHDFSPSCIQMYLILTLVNNLQCKTKILHHILFWASQQVSIYVRRTKF
jgi:hypothetical protein